MQVSILWQLIFQFVLILLNAVFSCAEIAVISMSELKLAQLTQKGDRRAKTLSRLMAQPARFLATIQVAITLAGFLGSAFAAENFSSQLAQGLQSFHTGLSISSLNTISLIIITLILSYITLIFGELIPKRIAMQKSEMLALQLASLIDFIAHLFAPIVAALTYSTNFILRLLGIKLDEQEAKVSLEDIELIIEKGYSEGLINNEKKNIIQNVFAFKDLTVGEFATHRANTIWLWTSDSLEEWEKTLLSDRHTIYPVCKDSVDQVIGILDARNFFKLRERTMEKVLEKAVKPAYFVPQTLKAEVLFQEMRTNLKYFAIVLNEYGETVGIVTMKDLVEQLVGKIYPDAIENAEAEIQQMDGNTWKIGGLVQLDEVASALGIPFPVQEYETFGGYVFSLYGSVPQDGSQFELDTEQLHIQAVKIYRHKLEQAIVSFHTPRSDN